MVALMPTNEKPYTLVWYRMYHIDSYAKSYIFTVPGVHQPGHKLRGFYDGLFCFELHNCGTLLKINFMLKEWSSGLLFRIFLSSRSKYN